MDYPSQYILVRFVKFVSVLTYAGGVGAGLLATDVRTRKRAVHLVASPALLATWLAGYALTFYLRVELTEAWVVGGFVLSLVSHLLLTQSARQPFVSPGRRAGIVTTLLATVLLMVFRPTWWSLVP